MTPTCLVALVAAAALVFAGSAAAAVEAADAPAAPAPPPALIVTTVLQEEPLQAYLLSAGVYVLEVGSLSTPAKADPGKSEVPLPGALWLFGSALVAFLGISGHGR